MPSSMTAISSRWTLKLNRMQARTMNNEITPASALSALAPIGFDPYQCNAVRIGPYALTTSAGAGHPRSPSQAHTAPATSATLAAKLEVLTTSLIRGPYHLAPNQR